MQANIEIIQHVLNHSSPISARDIKKVTSLQKSEINKILYKFTGLFKHTKVGCKPMWENINVVTVVNEPVVTVVPPNLDTELSYKEQVFDCLTELNKRHATNVHIHIRYKEVNEKLNVIAENVFEDKEKMSTADYMDVLENIELLKYMISEE